jgi:hypothetical protein
VAGHEAFVVTSGAACVLLHAKVRSMTQRRGSPGTQPRGSPGRLRASAYPGHADAGLVVVVTRPDHGARARSVSAEQHTANPGQCRHRWLSATFIKDSPGATRAARVSAELVARRRLTHSDDEANFFRKPLCVIRKGAGLYAASSL